MTETPDKEEKTTEKVVVMVEKANETMDNARSVMDTIKWAAMAIVALVVLFGGWTVYKMLSAPAKAVGNVVGGVSDAVQSSTDKVKDGASDIYNRLRIPVDNPKAFNKTSESAFNVLADMAETEPEGVKDRMFRAANFGGSQGRVCKMSLDFGNGPVDVFAAADIDAYETARDLGSKADRLMRMVILTSDDDISMNASWDETEERWILKWKATTVSKVAPDNVVSARAQDVLKSVPGQCGA